MNDGERAKGTRPEGAQGEAEASRHVREMFSTIAGRYDFLNHLLSLESDRVWRRRAARRFFSILANSEACVLDACCGTGDMVLALERQARVKRGDTGKAIVGSDFVLPMLTLAREKAERGHARVNFVAADSLALPFGDASFDLVTSAFGFRNLVNYRQGLEEFGRVLRRGGEVGILEFSEPGKGAFAALYRFYFKHVLPRLGGAISGERQAYQYLPYSVTKFAQPDELARWMEDAGFCDVSFESWMFGAVVLHTGRWGGES
jgi:demethylmenaquinone methyltransferase / 2-methoxy-6-polyprenyl-1,4-benzoquinol methylase